MTEQWQLIDGVWVATDTVIVKRLSKKDLLADKAICEAELARINEDIAQIELLESE